MRPSSPEPARLTSRSVSAPCACCLQRATRKAPCVHWWCGWEPDPPEGVEGLSWVLLTSVPVQTLEQAWERVDWDRARWIGEDYHQGLKTGCRIELRQVQS